MKLTNKLKLLLNTIKFLKFIQIYYRLFYFLRTRYRKLIKFKYTYTKTSSTSHLRLKSSIHNQYSVYKNNEFNFLNLSQQFPNGIDWNYNKYGKLWTYNLTYFEYLSKNEDVHLIYDFIENIESIKDGLEPFPISLRGINWIKFLTKFHIEDKKIDNSLYAQYYILLDTLEYHLLGNHLLENGFSLLFGAYYFQDEILYDKAFEILTKELNEQILKDGGHFELSPMYHKIMLFRVLDCINLIQNNSNKNDDLLKLLTSKAKLMLGWLKNIIYNNGDIPLFNDSANKIAPASQELFNYAKQLNIKMDSIKLSDSGYRRIAKDNYECVVDIGSAGAEYIPGHAHADTFNFELRINDRPFIVDSGVSTYETNEVRFYERSTKAHNAIEVLGRDSSEVWSGFRVADRAHIIEFIESASYIKATHDGYRKDNIFHTRSWYFEDTKIIIEDSLNNNCEAIFRLHFHPDVREHDILTKIDNLTFTLSSYNYAKEFNKIQKALVLEIPLTKELKVEINI